MAMSFMYSQGFWIESIHASKLGNLLVGFVQSYETCAAACYRDRLNRFALVPKLHMVHHCGLRLIHDSRHAPWVISPLSTCVQQEEDYIGKPSRLSRRVTAGRLMHTRVLERSLICSMFALKESDHDDRGLA